MLTTAMRRVYEHTFWQIYFALPNRSAFLLGFSTAFAASSEVARSLAHCWKEKGFVHFPLHFVQFSSPKLFVANNAANIQWTENALNPCEVGETWHVACSRGGLVHKNVFSPLDVAEHPPSAAGAVVTFRLDQPVFRPHTATNQNQKEEESPAARWIERCCLVAVKICADHAGECSTTVCAHHQRTPLSVWKEGGSNLFWTRTNTDWQPEDCRKRLAEWELHRLCLSKTYTCF